MTKKANSVKTTAPAQTKRQPKEPSNGRFSYCRMPEAPARSFSPDVNPNRVRLIRISEKKWVNGTVLHYYFFDNPTDGERVFLADGTSQFIPWTTTDEEKDVVRAAFKKWKDVGIGLNFEEVSSREDAEVRIGFMRGDGAWSFVGRDALDYGPNERTMNFGWQLTRRSSEIDTAVHEIGHLVGFPHEHQNPNAGIVWNEEAVYAALAKPPNSWSRQTTFWNIIRKIDPDTVQGSSWDPNSIMHYPFERGLINEPAQYRQGLQPAGALSQRDITWVRAFYPPLNDADLAELKPLESVPLTITAGQQKNFRIQPPATRNYEIRTFGDSDIVAVLFEDDNGQPKYLSGDDDSGENRNSYMKIKLFKDRKYILRVRLYYAERHGEAAVMMW
jgi:hypothetical protein